MKKYTKGVLGVCGAVLVSIVLLGTFVQANSVRYHQYIGHGDGNIVAGRKNASTLNAYNSLQQASVAQSVTFWIDHNGAARTQRLSQNKGTGRVFPYTDPNWSGRAMLRGSNNNWISGEESIYGNVNFDHS